MSEIVKQRKFKIILKSRVRGLGNKGSVKEVAKGYFRNYLSPMNLAVKFTEELFKELNHSVNTKISNESAIKIYNILNNKSLLMEKEASGNEVLYSSIRKQDLVNIIFETYGCQISKEDIVLNEVIKRIGMFKISIDIDGQIINMNLFVAKSMDDAIKMEQTMIAKEQTQTSAVQ